MLATKTDGTGPYALTQAVSNDHYTLTKHAGYTWGPNGATTSAAGLPDTINVKIIPNETTAANLLLSGQLNAANIVGPDTARLEAAQPVQGRNALRDRRDVVQPRHRAACGRPQAFGWP